MSREATIYQAINGAQDMPKIICTPSMATRKAIAKKAASVAPQSNTLSEGTLPTRVSARA